MSRTSNHSRENPFIKLCHWRLAVLVLTYDNNPSDNKLGSLPKQRLKIYLMRPPTPQTKC